MQRKVKPNQAPGQMGFFQAGFQVTDPDLPVSGGPAMLLVARFMRHHLSSERLFDQILQLNLRRLNETDQANLIAQ